MGPSGLLADEPIAAAKPGIAGAYMSGAALDPEIRFDWVRPVCPSKLRPPPCSSSTVHRARAAQGEMPVGAIDQDMVVPRSGAGFEVHMITGKARSLLVRVASAKGAASTHGADTRGRVLSTPNRREL